ncbi:MAG: aminoacyl-histidine dipeptidase [Clostridia bacterium]|nr:aminoacyl-histidine dipeptidase [Clostridia bacterium]
MKFSSLYEPKKMLEFFELLSSVPHGSGNTKQISDICVDFAKKRGLSYVQDEWNNVIIRKPGSKGKEGLEPVILQGHLDMVCAKLPDDPVDMSVTPVKLCCDGTWLYAENTSLGGDNIFAIASIMAILDDGTLSHPPIEALFTTDEETGMFGANGLDASNLKGKRMLNLDSEEEGVFTVSCAGGVRADCRIPVTRESPDGSAFYLVTVGGLLGGHSGMEIVKERGNSNKIAGRALYEAAKRFGIRLCGMSGGKFDNVITMKTEAVVAVDMSEAAEFEEFIRNFDKILKNEYSSSDPGVYITAEKTKYEGGAVNAADTERALGCLFVLPQGVQSMSVEIPDLPETSLNMGVLKLGETELKFGFSIRSSVRTRKEELYNKVETVVKLCGGAVSPRNSYPEWAYKKHSPVRETALEAYKELYGKEAVISATHGGLECGLFADKIKDLDCVSFGPELCDVHSVRERLNLPSAKRIYDLVCLILAKLN